MSNQQTKHSDFEFKKIGDLEYIIYTKQSPHFAFRVFKFYEKGLLEKFLIHYNLLDECAIIPGYLIPICYVGSQETGISADPIPAIGGSIPQEVKDLFESVTIFYFESRVKKNENRFRKNKSQEKG
jgi:hypothetical protein